MAVSLHYLILNSPNARLSYPISFLLGHGPTSGAYSADRTQPRGTKSTVVWIAWLVGMGRSGDAATHTVFSDAW